MAGNKTGKEGEAPSAPKQATKGVQKGRNIDTKLGIQAGADNPQHQYRNWIPNRRRKGSNNNKQAGIQTTLRR